jgi:tetratricopeptide (TPR) repeat protein
LGYVSILTNNKNTIESTIKKLTKNSPMFSQFNESVNDKNKIFKNAYSFLLTILKVNNKEKVEKQKEIAANFKSYFLPDLNSAKNNNFKNQFIITESNFYNCVVNLDIINNMDYETETFWKKNVYEPLLSVVSQNNPLQHSAVVTFILSIHKQINHLIESYCTDFYKDSYKNKIIELSEKTLAYVKNYYSDEFFFHTEFVKGALIDIISAYAHIFLYNKEYNKMKNVVIFFDELNKVLKFNENTPSYELICKIKGDYWLFSSFKDIKASLVFYEKALQLLPNHHPKKPIILFNMGYCHFVNDNKKMAMEYLNRCVSEFNSVDLTKSPFDFYCRPNALSKKVNIAKRMISLMLENE